jgi:hypothetical protein
MSRVARLTLAAAGALLAGAVSNPAYAAAVHADFQPHAVVGATISHGADGVEQTLLCPPDENVLSGGFTVSAPSGRMLGSVPADVLTSRPTADTTGWIVAVGKSLRPTARGGATSPADLTIQAVCTEGEVTPGA